MRIAARPHHAASSWRLTAVAKREEHCRHLVFCQRPVFAVFNHTHNFSPYPIQNLKWPPIAFCTDPKTFTANARFTKATFGAFSSSCRVISLPASKLVPAASR